MSEQRVVELSPEAPQLWCESPPIISASGFVPVTEARLVTSCRDGAGRLWQSQNGYLVSAESRFATDTTAAVGDDYYGIAAEGPIYSLRCTEGVGHDFVLPSSGEFELEFKIFDGSSEIWSDSARRTTTTNEGVSAQLGSVCFLHNGTVGAEHGCSMLKALGYQVTAHAISPESLDLDPLLEELRERRPFHLIASGRASEVALELAQRLPQLLSVTTFSGSGLRFSPWRIEGETLGHVVCDHSAVQPREGSAVAARKVYAEAVVDRSNRDRGRIEVEKIACPVYLFSGSDDQIWPSAAFSELVSQRRKAHGLEELTHHQTFPSVGYDLGPELGLPGLPTTERTMSHPTTGLRLALGGKMGRQSRARRECWSSLLQILSGKRP